MSETPTPGTDYIESRCIPEPNSGCWLWIRAINSRGYGQAVVGGEIKQAHRVSYEVFIGSAEGFLVLHSCDTKSCVNPAHLHLGTDKENLVEAYARKRRNTPLGVNARELAKSALERCGTTVKAAKFLNVSRHVVYNWTRRIKKESAI